MSRWWCASRNTGVQKNIRKSYLRDMYRMATTTAGVTPGTHNPSISAQTVHNRLREARLRACRPVVRQVLNRHHRQQRRLWEQTHRRWTRQDWQKVLFHWWVKVLSHQWWWSESRFSSKEWALNRGLVSGAGSRWRVRHGLRQCVIAGNLNGVCYREDILLPHVVPFLQAHPDMTLQHDNATSHTARSVREFLQNMNVSVLP